MVGFGLWTVAANVIVLSGGSFHSLARIAPAILLGAVVVTVFLMREGRNASPPQTPLPSPVAAPPAPAALVVGAASAALFAFLDLYLAFWAVAVLMLGCTFLRTLRQESSMETVGPRLRWDSAALTAAILLALGSTLFLNRPNIDQTINLNMAVSVMDQPQAPVYRADTLHGLAGAYFIPSYRVHSFELLGALAAQAVGLEEPIAIFHFGFAPLLGVLSVFAAALLFRRLLPDRWGWATLALTGILLIFHQTYTTYGNLAYVRLFEGKGVFVTLLIPLILLYALNFTERPGWKTWILLALAQVGSVGLTANALYAAPMAAGFGLGAGWRPSRKATERLLIGLAASAYPVGVGLVVRAAFLHEGLVQGLEAFQGLMPIEQALHLNLGDRFPLWFSLLAVTSAWTLVRPVGTRRWIRAYSFAFVLLCLNPFLTGFWGVNVTGPYLTWRLLWALPLPIFMAALLVEGIARGPASRLGQGFVAIALGATILIGRPWQEPTPTFLAMGLKVPQPEYAIAGRLNLMAGDGNLVLAPETVAAWLPTFRDHAMPVVARTHYTEGILSVFAGQVDRVEVLERLALHELVIGVPGAISHLPLLERWVGEGRLAAVAVPASHGDLEAMSNVLEEGGMLRVDIEGYSLFSLPE